jgi:hypothetical protein
VVEEEEELNMDTPGVLGGQVVVMVVRITRLPKMQEEMLPHRLLVPEVEVVALVEMRIKMGLLEETGHRE